MGLRTWSGIFWAFTHLYSGPFFERANGDGHILISTLFRSGNPDELPDRAPDDHRDAQRFGFLQAHSHVLVQQADSESGVELSRDHTSRNFIGRRAVASRPGVDDVANLPGVKARFDSQH